MKLFVTGASGFVGGAVVKHFCGDHQVLALARSESSAEKVRALGAEAVPGSLGDVSAEMLRGVDTVIHSAARAEDWGSREQFVSANVDGTRAVLEAARAAGVRTFVFIGTEASFFIGGDMVDLDESASYPARTPFLYSETKARSEAAVLAAGTDEFRTMSIRPRFVWGPGDNSVLPTVVEMVRRGQFMWVGGGRYETDTTYIDNLVHAIALGIEKGRSGEAYFVTDGERSTLRAFLTAYAATWRVALPDKNIGRGLARFAASTVEGLWRLLGLRSRPPMTKFAIYMMSSRCTINIDKARRELGYLPIVSVAEGLRASHDQFVAV